MEAIYCELPNRKFGVELELTANMNKGDIKKMLVSHEVSRVSGREVKMTYGNKGWAETEQNKFWHVKYDSTCGPQGKYKDHGWEVASYIAQGSEDLTNICQATDYLRNKGCKTNTNCGLHCHVEVSDFRTPEIVNLLASWLKIEHLVYALADPSRLRSIYCKPLRQRYEEARRPTRLAYKIPGDMYSDIIIEVSEVDLYAQGDDYFWQAMKPKSTYTHDNNEKKFALNFVNYVIAEMQRPDKYHKTTVELRLPECILRGGHVQGWVGMFLSFVESCSTPLGPLDVEPVDDVAEFLRILGLHGSDEIFLFLDPHLRAVKVWVLENLLQSEMTTKMQKKQAKKLLALLV